MTADVVRDGRLAAAARPLADAPQVAVIGRRNSYPVALHLRRSLPRI